MDRKRSLSTALALGLTVALLASLPLRPDGAASMAQGPEPEANTEPLAPVGTAFTYQGRLQKDGVPVDDTCDLQFSLWDAGSDGSQVGPLVTRTGVEIAEGLFTIADLDFGAVFNGEARWLEVAVQCSGETIFTVLSPRQELTTVPYASYAAQVGAHSHLGQTWSGSGNPLVIGGSFGGLGGAPLVLGNDTGHGLQVSQAEANGVAVDWAGWHGVEVAYANHEGMRVDQAGRHGMYVVSAGDDGVRVDSAWDGVHVSSAGDCGVRVDAAGGDGVYVERAGNPSTVNPSQYYHGFEVAGAAGHGLRVGQADLTGVVVHQAGADGVYVRRAGLPSSTYPDLDHSNGIEVAGAEGYGVWVGRADQDGLYVGSAGDNGLYVESAGNNGVYVASASTGMFVADAAYGVIASSANYGGMVVWETGGDGVRVYRAGSNGVVVDMAGQPSSTYPDPYEFHDGLEVAGAEGNGLWVGRADLDGVYVYQAGDDGVCVNSAADIGAYADTTYYNHEWGFYTPDKIYAGSALTSGGPMMIVAQNGGSEDLEPGDVVVVAGMGAAFGESGFPTPLVRQAGQAGGAVAGVVYQPFVAEERVETVERDGQAETHTSPRSRSTEGTIAPGDYLLVVVLGPAQVKASALAGAIRPGDLLVVARDGQAAVMQAAGAYVPGSLVGTAMEGLEAAQVSGLIWVLVQPR